MKHCFTEKCHGRFIWGCKQLFCRLSRKVPFQYAHNLLQYCQPTTYRQLWLKIPLIQPFKFEDCYRGEEDNSVPSPSSWDLWNDLRTCVGHVHNLSVLLELSSDCRVEEGAHRRWTGEPVRGILLPTSMFLPNKAGYPVLARTHQGILTHFLAHKVHVIFQGKPWVVAAAGASSGPEGAHVPSHEPYAAYIRHLQEQYQTSLSRNELQFRPYSDRLQHPLQPLMDNLEAQTYETFEQDSPKYIYYQRAVVAAIKHMQKQWSSNSSSALNGSSSDHKSCDSVSKYSATNLGVADTLVVTVVGAGRGPLVAASLAAALETHQPVRIYAVEKNENAVVMLRNRVKNELWSNVTVVQTDMRQWSPPEPAHLLVSELLGSWGDNELSPECLDGAQKSLLRSSGISIPMDYTSYIAPINASKLWTCVRDMPAQKDVLSSLHSPYVVKLHNYYPLAASQPLFSFAHPNWTDVGNNDRYRCVSFNSCDQSLLHGFAGTFQATLFRSVSGGGGVIDINKSIGSSEKVDRSGSGSHYDEDSEPVVLSTVPESHTPDMYSWFPLFLPLAAPVLVRQGDTITVCIWRCSDSRRVWYEWCLTSPMATAVQNQGGASSWIGL